MLLSDCSDLATPAPSHEDLPCEWETNRSSCTPSPAAVTAWVGAQLGQHRLAQAVTGRPVGQEPSPNCKWHVLC